MKHLNLALFLAACAALPALAEQATQGIGTDAVAAVIDADNLAVRLTADGHVNPPPPATAQGPTQNQISYQSCRVPPFACSWLPRVSDNSGQWVPWFAKSRQGRSNHVFDMLGA